MCKDEGAPHVIGDLYIPPDAVGVADCLTLTAKETPGCRLLKEAGRVGDTAREVWERAAGLEQRLLTSDGPEETKIAVGQMSEEPNAKGLLDNAADRVQDASRTLDLTLAILVRLEHSL